MAAPVMRVPSVHTVVGPLVAPPSALITTSTPGLGMAAH